MTQPAKNEVATQKLTSVPAVNTGASCVEMSEKDKLYSVARIIQAMSADVIGPDGKAFVKGDMVVFPAKKKISDIKSPFRVVFLRNTLDWANFEVVNGKEEWRSEEPRTADSEGWELEFKHDGKPFKRYRQITGYFLLPDEIDAFVAQAESDNPNLDATIDPVAIKVRNYSRNAIQVILKHVTEKLAPMNSIRAAKGKELIQPYSYQHILQVKETENDKGIFYTLEYVKAEPITSPTVLSVVKEAFERIQKAKNLRTVAEEETTEQAPLTRNF